MHTLHSSTRQAEVGRAFLREFLSSLVYVKSSRLVRDTDGDPVSNK